jgi:diguanylate cyclase (GGDEF)-like protein/PAS domain S-box-containing protein
VLLVRGKRRFDRLGVSLDAAIVAIAIGAIAYQLIFVGFIKVAHASEVVGGHLVYPVLAFAVLLTLGLLCAPSRSRLGGAYLALGAGTLLLFVTDVLLVRQVSEGAYAPDTLLDLGWPAAMLVLAFASRLGTSLRRVGALPPRLRYGVIGLSFALSFALLLFHALRDQDPVMIVLTTLVPCLIVLRLTLSLRENDRLARDNFGILRAAGEGIVRTDRKGSITFVNPAALRMLGYTADELRGRPAHDLLHHTRPNGTPYPASECPARRSLTEGATHRITDELFWRKDGSSIPVDYTSAPDRKDGRIVGSVVVFDDVTRQREMNERLRHQADHDSLTGLFNRRRFGEELSEKVRYARMFSRPGALLLLDLDSFKFINDTYGHPVGDRLLCDVAATLTATLRETDIVARLGGDEFAVLLRETSEEKALEVAKGLIAAIRACSEPSLGASAGVAIFAGAARRTPDELLIAADVALYQAKEAGGGTVAAYSGENGQALTWVERIRAAIAEDRLVVYAQPIVDLQSGEVAREELLVRMVDEHGDRIPPSAFLSAAERFGLINEIDLLVLDRGIELAGRTKVSTNVSALSLSDPRLLGRLERAISEGLDPRWLSFEITETAAVANMEEALAFARRLRELGCSLALDDFGTGYSSFAYLKHIPAQYLKIDMEFIREIERNPADQQLVQAIVSVAHGLGQKTVAEGVEDGRTLALVRELGVDYAQGFYLGRPAPAAEPLRQAVPHAKR